MGNPTIDDTGVSTNDNSGKENGLPEEFTPRTNPTCKTLQQDLARVHAIIRNTKNEVLNSMNAGLDDIKEILTDPQEGVIPRLSSLEQSSSSYKTRLDAIEEKLALVEAADHVTLQASPTHDSAIADLNRRFQVTTTILECFEKKLHSSNSRILHNTQLLNVNNYRISGIPFSPDENPVEVTTKFFKDIMMITVKEGEIVVASCLPSTITVRIQGNRVELPPQMFVKVTPHLQRRIAANINVLDGKTDPADGHYYKVKQQLPDATQGARQHFNKVVIDVQEKNKVKPKNERVPFYFQGYDLYVGGRKVCEPVNPPALSSLLKITPMQQKILDDINVPELAYVERNGSKFHGYAIRVYDYPIIKHLYLRLRQLH